jgi:RNA polymerase sigma-70 factor (ECF subfamily)
MKVDQAILTTLQHRISNSEQQAIADLYRLFASRLFNFALLYVHRKEVAEEIVQDIMVKVWSKRDTISGIQNLETYLFVATRNLCLNHRAKFSSLYLNISWPDEHAEIINVNDPARELEWKEIHFRLTQAIDALPDQCRTVFKLIKEEGFRYKQAAEILGISPRTVETQLFRALKKLTEVINLYSDKSDIQ